MQIRRMQVVFLSWFFCLAWLVQLPLEKWFVGDNAGWNPLNYAALLLAMVWLIAVPPMTLNRTRAHVLATIVGVLVVNTLFAPYGDVKWLANQCGFLICTFVISRGYADIDEQQVAAMSTFLSRLAMAGVILVGASVLYLVVVWHGLLVAIARSLRTDVFNGLLYQLMLHFSWQKQAIGAFAALVLGILFVLRPRLFAFLLVACLPLLAGIRNFWLAMTLAVVFVWLRRRKSLLLVGPLGAGIVLLYFSSELLPLLCKLNYRLSSYLNTLYIVGEFPFGVGLGGYHTYVVAEARTLVASYPAFAVVDFAEAPESDIALILGSLGLSLGLVFYAVNLFVMVRLWKAYEFLPDGDRVFSFLYFVSLFSGIAQDQVFGLPYWILFGFALGTATSARYTCRVPQVRRVLTSRTTSERTAAYDMGASCAGSLSSIDTRGRNEEGNCTD